MKTAPKFELSADDEFAPHCLLDYAARCRERGLLDVEAYVRKRAGDMFEWQQHNGKHLPVTPPDPPKVR